MGGRSHGIPWDSEPRVHVQISHVFQNVSFDLGLVSLEWKTENDQLFAQGSDVLAKQGERTTPVWGRESPHGGGGGCLSFPAGNHEKILETLNVF